MSKFIIIASCLFTIVSYSQETLNKEEVFSRQKADSIVRRYLKDEVLNRNYTLFSSGNKCFLVIIENETVYKEFLIIESYKKRKNFYRDTIYQKPNRLLNKMFNKNIYHEGFISVSSDFYKKGYEILAEEETYFVLMDKNNKRYGEAKLNFYITPNPIDPEVYYYFGERIFHYIEDNYPAPKTN